MIEKECNDCKKVKSEEYFYKREVTKYTLDGLSFYCKECTRRIVKKSHDKHRKNKERQCQRCFKFKKVFDFIGKSNICNICKGKLKVKRKINYVKDGRKICPHCHIEQPISAYDKNPSWCKTCLLERNKDKYQIDKQILSEFNMHLCGEGGKKSNI